MRPLLIWILVPVAVGCGERKMQEERLPAANEQVRIRMKYDEQELYIAPSTASASRTKVLPTEPSEDARHVLGRIEPPVPGKDEEQRDYLPDENVEWVVDVKFIDGLRVDPEAVSAAFGRDWEQEFGRFTFYGLDADTGHWSFLVSADGPQAVRAIKLAFDYVDVLDDDADLPTEKDFERRLREIPAKLGKVGILKNTTPNLSPVAAQERAKELRSLKRELDLSSVLILKAPAGKTFNGKVVWDVMLCLGLKWGDMDGFHWENDSEIGADSVFSVSTTTPPGYFLPEEVAADRVHVEDLVFSFSVPRSSQPVEVFDSMSRGVEYCRKRLDGMILDENGKPADLPALRQRIADVAQQLEKAGLPPGSDSALRLF